ncbi:MAG: hypothetical protein QOH56_2864 [Pseudonocardiales bacterium]|nr:hypothetical protein [Pseudonocardiales bacterium]
MKLPVIVATAVLALSLPACASTTNNGGGARSGSATAASTSVTASASETDTDGPSAGAASAPCGAAARPDPKAARQLPAGFPTVTGWRATEVVTQGRTHAIHGSVPAELGEIVAMRDAAVAAIGAAGYVKTGSDQEPGFEADADFDGPHRGNLRVRALCSGYLDVIYTIEQ